MPVLQYYSASGELKIFPNYDIGENGVITNIKTGQVISHHEGANGYKRASVYLQGKQRQVLVARALASTFLGSPPTLLHTVDHIDRDRGNDTLKNIRWEDRNGQAKNRTRPEENISAFVIIKGGVEHTAKEWTDIFKRPDGKKYVVRVINHFACQQLYGFRYKTFPNLRGEVWKYVKDSKNSQGEWFISSKNRMKYKTKHAENVLTAEQLSKRNGYPVVMINGKIWHCHELSMMIFRPREYASRLSGDMILHKNDDRNDFNPFRLRLGTSSENGTDAHDNGKYDGKKTKRNSVASYIDGVFEKTYPSIRAAARHIRNDYKEAAEACVRYALKHGSTKYGRTWIYIDASAIKSNLKNVITH